MHCAAIHWNWGFKSFPLQNPVTLLIWIQKLHSAMEQIYFITKQTYVVITLFCRGMGYVPFTHVWSWFASCRKYALFGFVLCRLLRRHLGFDSDFAQISGQKIGGWQLWFQGQSPFRLLYGQAASSESNRLAVDKAPRGKIVGPFVLNTMVVITIVCIEEQPLLMV